MSEYFGLFSIKDAQDFAAGMRNFILYEDCDNHNPDKWDYGIAHLRQERKWECRTYEKESVKKMRAVIADMKKNPRKPDTTIRGGDPKCRHRFKIWGTNVRILSLNCEKCEAQTERATTPREKRKYMARDRRQHKHSMTIHKISHAFQRKFTCNFGMRFSMKGYQLIKAIERFAKKYPSIQQVGVDDDHHAGSDMFLIPHETPSNYWGTSVVYVPQCTGEAAIRFFMYPGHLNGLVKALVKIQKRTIRKNKHTGRKGEDY